MAGPELSGEVSGVDPCFGGEFGQPELGDGLASQALFHPIDRTGSCLVAMVGPIGSGNEPDQLEGQSLDYERRKGVRVPYLSGNASGKVEGVGFEGVRGPIQREVPRLGETSRRRVRLDRENPRALTPHAVAMRFFGRLDERGSRPAGKHPASECEVEGPAQNHADVHPVVMVRLDLRAGRKAELRDPERTNVIFTEGRRSVMNRDQGWNR